jgi:hypothetical protein
MLHIPSSPLVSRRPLVLSVILTLTLISGTVAAGTTASSSASLQQTGLHHWGWANPRIAAMVEHFDQALSGKESVLAASNLAYAHNIARSIELQMPFYVMKDRLGTAKGKLEAGATHAFIDQLAPVYDSVADLQLVAPDLGREVHDSIEQAQRLARSGRRDQALQQVDRVLDKIVSVRVYVPILDIQGQIDAARKALQQDDMPKARDRVDKALVSMIAIVQGGNSGL